MALIENSTNSLVSGTNDKDAITNRADYATIASGAGNDSIVNWGNNSSVNGQGGNVLMKYNPQ